MSDRIERQDFIQGMGIAAAAIAVALLINIRSSQATEGPWCASVNIGAGTEVENCSMRSLEMCRHEVIAGNRGSCYPNPRLPGPGHASVRLKRGHY
jgi:Protein of unknown function (DUF3551)